MSLAAQNTEPENLNREMTLEREYDPIVQDATKVNTLPEVKEMTITKRPIVYSDYIISLFPEKRLTILPAMALDMPVAHSLHNGYLHIAGGMFFDIAGDFGYHILNTETSKLGVWFTHRSTNGNVRFIDNDTLKRKAVINDNIGGLDFRRRFDASVLQLGGKFGYSAFNYYGIPTNKGDYTLSNNEPEGSDYKSNQGARLINVNAALASLPDSEAWGYHAGIDFTNFNYKYVFSKFDEGMSENHFKIDFGLKSPVKDGKSYGVNLNANVLSYTAPVVSGYVMPEDIFNTHFNATLNPFFLLDKGTWRLLLGLNLMAVNQNAKSNFYASPNIEFQSTIANFTIFYADLKGKIESNSMAELSRVNRYINPAFPADASKTWADMVAGIRSSAADGLWLNIFAGFNYTESEVFFNPSLYGFMEDGFNNVGMLYQPSSLRLQVGGELKYDFRQVVDFYLKGVYSHYSLKDPVDSWKFEQTSAPPFAEGERRTTPLGKPSLAINAGVNAHLLKPLSVSLDYSMLSGMYALLYDKSAATAAVEHKMKAVNDLRLRAAWLFSDKFSLYAQFNNLLFQRHELVYGYPLQPFAVMAGLNLNF